MSSKPRVLLDLPSFGKENIRSLFSLAKSLMSHRLLPRQKGETAALLFFEPSTRTRLSFETACHRAGLAPLVFTAGHGTSMEKGETVQDSVLNIAAMEPSVIVIRVGDQVDLKGLSNSLPMPIINAGWGNKGHPTQALLDLFTIEQHRPLSECKILFLGDLTHSRVASSHFEVLSLFGAQAGVFGPSEMLPQGSHFRTFPSLEQGLGWANVVMAFRYQMERHKDKNQKNNQSSDSSSWESFGLREKHLQLISPEALILHPGPVNKGLEMDEAVYNDPRSLILEQTNRGVHIREALLRILLEGR